MLLPTQTRVQQACLPHQEAARVNAPMRAAGLLACLSSLLGCVSQGITGEALAQSAPPRHCEMQLEAWCILKDNNTIEVAESTDQGYRYIWTMRGQYWSNHPSVILEPAGCRNGRSDVFELIHFDRNVSRGDRRWDILTVRLRSDASCDLKLLSPIENDDPVGASYSANLSLIRACQAQSCDGPTVGQLNPPRRE